jgi:hypothetical protein
VRNAVHDHYAAAVTNNQYREGFKTTYLDHTGQMQEHKFDTAAENNEFAFSIGLMDVRDVRKFWYSWAMDEWFRYHNNRS